MKKGIALLILMSIVVLYGGGLMSQHQAEASGQAFIQQTVSLRTGPNVLSQRIRYVQKNEVVTVIERHNSYWYRVKDQYGQIGYMSSNQRFITMNANAVQVTSNRIASAKAVDKVIDVGLSYWGTPYEFGSSRANNNTFDCSDFVRVAFKEAVGITLPSDSRKQAAYVREMNGVSTNWQQLKRGDLMFFMSYRGSRAADYSGIQRRNERVTHVAIYLGDGKLLHTWSKSSGGVRTDSLVNKHWEHRFLFGGSAM
jgi:cell wall-associated NlpC family hydrolase